MNGGRIQDGEEEEVQRRADREEAQGGEVEISRGQTVGQVCRKLGVSENTYYRWRKEYGGLKLDQAKRLKELEQENTRLKRIVADQQIDISILKEVADPKF